MSAPNYYGGGWWMAVDPKTNKIYYYDDSGAVSWYKPVVAGATQVVQPLADTPASPVSGQVRRPKSMRDILKEVALAEKSKEESETSPRLRAPTGESLDSPQFAPRLDIRRVPVVPTTSKIQPITEKSETGVHGARKTIASPLAGNRPTAFPSSTSVASSNGGTGSSTKEDPRRARMIRRSSLELVESGLVQSVLQQAATAAGGAPKLAMFYEALEAAAQDGYVDFNTVAEALSRYLGIDDPALHMAYFRGFLPVVKVANVTAKMSAITHGTLDDAIGFAWDCYSNAEGYVEAGHFVNLAIAAVSAQAKRRKLTVDTHKLRTEVLALFRDMDHSWGESLMSREEFEDFVLLRQEQLIATCAAALSSTSARTEV